MTRFLKIFFLTLGGGLAAIAALNALVDPYASFHWADSRGLNDQKRLKTGGGRVNKSVILARHRFDTILLGTSTVETGLDPNGRVLGGQNAYNAALPFSSAAETVVVADYILARQSPTRVVIGLDFAVFAKRPVANADFNESAFAGKSLAAIYLQRLFAEQSLKDSVGTLRDSLAKKVSPYSKYGNYDPKAASARIDFSAQMASSLDAYLIATYPTMRVDAATVDRFFEAVGRLRQKGIRVDLFISPLHVLHLAAIETAGLQTAFETWKRDLAEHAAKIDGVALWDFSYPNAITRDPVPAQPGGAMVWYWDAAHYNSSAGDLILCRLSGCTALSVPDDFGVKLTPATIDGALASYPRAGEGSLAAFSPELNGKARSIARR